MKLFFFTFFLMLSQTSGAQHLVPSIETYYTKLHFKYDSEFIRSNRIRSMETVTYHYYQDSIHHTDKSDKYEFNPAGKTLCERCESRIEHQPKIDCEYDSLNRLVKKSILTPSPKNYRQLRPSDMYVWKYNKKGELCKVLRYMMLDRISTVNGVHYFPEKWMLYGCDSISYNYVDSSVTIQVNYREHCSNDSIELYTHIFSNPKTVRLYFHPNGNLKERITLIDEEISSSEHFDFLGRLKMEESESPAQRLMDLLDYSGPLPMELSWLYGDNVLTTADNDSVVVFESNVSSLFQPLYSLSDEEGNNSILTIDLRTKTLYFQNRTLHNYINHRGTVITITRHLKTYNERCQVISHETWTSSSGDGLFEFEITQDFSKNTPVERYAIAKFEYYDNGLLKCFTDFDADGKIIAKTVNEMTYFE